MNCLDCGARSHKGQLEKFPVGTRIVTIAEIHSGSGIAVVPFGSTGIVTDHCHDGRAWISFDNYEHGHTFHFPEQNVAAKWKAKETP